MQRAVGAGLIAFLVIGCSPSTTEQLTPGPSSFSVSGQFHGIRAADGFDVTVVPGTTSEAVVDVEGASPSDAIVTIRRGILELRAGGDQLPPGVDLRARVTTASLESVQAVTGASVSFTDGALLSAAAVRADLSAGASLNADVACSTLTMSMQAGSTATLTGSADRVRIEAGQSSRLDATELQAADAVVTAGGASKVTVAVSRTLAVDATSGAEVTYNGDPRIVRRRVASGGTVARVAQ